MTRCDTGHGGQVAAVAAAMVRHVLPAAPSLRLEVTEDTCGGTWLHLTYPAPRAAPAPGPGPAPGGLPPAADLVLIDSAAHRWGHFGDSRWHTLWALLQTFSAKDARSETFADLTP